MEKAKTRERLDQVGELAEKFEPGAVDEVMNAMEAVEKENPEALDSEKVAEWCSNRFFSLTQDRVLQHPESVYRQRFGAVAERLEHPLLLIHIMETIVKSFYVSTTDPLNDLDELLGVMTAKR